MGNISLGYELLMSVIKPLKAIQMNCFIFQWLREHIPAMKDLAWQDFHAYIYQPCFH